MPGGSGADGRKLKWPWFDCSLRVTFIRFSRCDEVLSRNADTKPSSYFGLFVNRMRRCKTRQHGIVQRFITGLILMATQRGKLL